MDEIVDWLLDAPWPFAVGLFAAPLILIGFCIGWALFG